MAINGCELDAIRSRANHGTATSKDCQGLLDYMKVNLTPEKFSDKIECAVESAIEGAISQTRIVNAVETAIRELRL